MEEPSAVSGEFLFFLKSIALLLTDGFLNVSREMTQTARRRDS
jgi:hypothetical protein